MSYYISVSTLDNSAKWEVVMNADQKAVIEGLVLGNQKNNQTLAQFVPIRTNNLKNLFQDLFFPATRRVLTWNINIVTRIALATLCIFQDLLTLPIRVLTCIPRMVVNATQQEHPLHRYLANLNVDSKILNSDAVNVRITEVICRPSANQRGGELLVDYNIADQVRKQVHFIAIPYLGSRSYSSGDIGGSRVPLRTVTAIINRISTNPDILAHFIPRPAAA